MPKSSLESLPNIGPKIAATLNKIGITDREQFLARDPYEIFHELTEKVDPSLCRCALASIVGAHHGVKWNTIHAQAAKEFDRLYPDHTWKNKC
ncbi:MAG TPA: TfoX/Sxy family DNA transformation protein [bacterium]|nr:TfoX/Sxy family DNA transformation protein [bacterium]